MKKIEPGCKAMIISCIDKRNSANIGEIVTCIDVAEYIYAQPSVGKVWEIDKPILWSRFGVGGQEKKFLAGEKIMIRIDDDANLLLENHDKELIRD